MFYEKQAVSENWCLMKTPPQQNSNDHTEKHLSNRPISYTLSQAEINKLKLEHLHVPAKKYFFGPKSSIDFAWGSYQIPPHCVVQMSRNDDNSLWCTEIPPSIWPTSIILSNSNLHNDICNKLEEECDNEEAEKVILIQSPTIYSKNNLYKNKVLHILNYSQHFGGNDDQEESDLWQVHENPIAYLRYFPVILHEEIQQGRYLLLKKVEKQSSNVNANSLPSNGLQFDSDHFASEISISHTQHTDEKDLNEKNDNVIIKRQYGWVYVKAPQNLKELNDWCDDLIWLKHEQMDPHVIMRAALHWTATPQCSTYRLDLIFPKNRTIPETLTQCSIDFQSNVYINTLFNKECKNINNDDCTTSAKVSNLLQTKDVKQNPPHIPHCGGNCNNIPAEFWCIDCNGFYCDRGCHSVNHRLQSNQNHQRVDLSDMFSKLMDISSNHEDKDKNSSKELNKGKTNFLLNIVDPHTMSGPSFALCNESTKFSDFSCTLFPDTLSFPFEISDMLAQLNTRLNNKMTKKYPLWKSIFPYQLGIDNKTKLALTLANDIHHNNNNCYDTLSKAPTCYIRSYSNEKLLVTENESTSTPSLYTMKITFVSPSTPKFSPGQVLSLLCLSNCSYFMQTFRVLVLSTDDNNNTVSEYTTTTYQQIVDILAKKHNSTSLYFAVKGPPQDFVYIMPRSLSLSQKLGMTQNTTHDDVNSNNMKSDSQEVIVKRNYIHSVAPISCYKNKFMFMMHPVFGSIHDPCSAAWAIVHVDDVNHSVQILKFNQVIENNELTKFLSKCPTQSLQLNNLKLILKDELGNLVNIEDGEEIAAFVTWV